MHTFFMTVVLVGINTVTVYSVTIAKLASDVKIIDRSSLAKVKLSMSLNNGLQKEDSNDSERIIDDKKYFYDFALGRYSQLLKEKNHRLIVADSSELSSTEQPDISELSSTDQQLFKDYTRAITLNPKDFEAYNNRGLLKDEKLNDLQGALADYNQAIIINPKFSKAYYNRAILKERLNNLKGVLGDSR